jgi:hypothetical protein
MKIKYEFKDYHTALGAHHVSRLLDAMSEALRTEEGDCLPGKITLRNSAGKIVGEASFRVDRIERMA